MDKNLEDNKIKKRLELLRASMSENKMDVYIIATGDYHSSEYTSEYFNVREYMSGFTGSAGTLVVTLKDAALFTDGRYFIQAENQLLDTGIRLVKMGVKDEPALVDYICEKVPAKGTVAFDGRVIDSKWGIELESALLEKKAGIIYDQDLVSVFWEDRPAFPSSKAFILEEKYSGEDTISKFQRVRAVMKRVDTPIHIIASLDDICWLYNIRGNDVRHNPVIMSYSVITDSEAILFINRNKLNEDLIKYLSDKNIVIRPYEEIYNYIKALRDVKVMLDKSRVNYAMYKSLDCSITVISGENPTVKMKAMKNKTEVENLKKVHIKDGAAVVRFMFWLKTSMEKMKLNESNSLNESAESKESITEITASDYLENCRRELEGFVEPSFDTISAYQANAAMMHYSATEDNCAVLRPEGMLLVDSGGQYYEGTTDITRTFALGEVTEDMKKHFTLTVKGMLTLANAKFLYGCDGFNLDILAREPLWNEGIDYRCGTGHGVGYFLNVHEAPNGFRWKHNPGYNDLCVFEEGMVTSDEPGVYIEGKYGIRIENEIVCKKLEENEYGQFMGFDMLTLVPVDLDLIDVRYLSDEDIDRLNSYHELVRRELSDTLTMEEKEFLNRYTREIKRDSTD